MTSQMARPHVRVRPQEPLPTQTEYGAFVDALRSRTEAATTPAEQFLGVVLYTAYVLAGADGVRDFELTRLRVVDASLDDDTLILVGRGQKLRIRPLLPVTRSSIEPLVVTLRAWGPGNRPLLCQFTGCDFEAFESAKAIEASAAAFLGIDRVLRLKPLRKLHNGAAIDLTHEAAIGTDEGSTLTTFEVGRMHGAQIGHFGNGGLDPASATELRRLRFYLAGFHERLGLVALAAPANLPRR